MGEVFQMLYYAVAGLALVVSAVNTYLLLRFATKVQLDDLKTEIGKQIAALVPRELFDRHRAETEARLQTGSEKMAGLTSVLQRLEQAIANLPTKDDLHELALALSGIGGDLKAARTEIKAVGDEVDVIRTSVNRHEEIIANAGGRP